MPVDVTGLEAGIAAIAGGGYHTCALTIEGGVACWGSNEYGQLGDGTTTDSTAPVEVLDAQGEPWTGITQVTAGAGHTCALTSADGVLCWGENDHGQLGNGTQNDVDYPTPAAVIGLDSGISAVISSATSTHTCALTTEGSLKCWGSNASGQLGDGTSGENNLSTVPVDVVDLEATATAITLGGAFGLGRGHTCALTAATTVKCWGYNGWSQLGNGTRFGPDIPTPNAVCEKFDEVLHECTEGLSSVVGVTAGGFHTCALPEAGGAKCWGTCVAGQLGAIPCPEAATPLDVSLDSDGDGMHDSYEMERDCLNWKVDDGTSDADGDGLENLAEFEERTNPCVQDTDGDGCTDWQETVLHHLSRGAHNPLNFWDFYDTPDVNNVRDRMVNVADIGRVVARFGARGDATADPLSPPPPAPAYHPAFDRNQDRNIDIGDISLTVYQFGLSCA